MQAVQRTGERADERTDELTGALLALGVGFAVTVDAATLSGPVTGGTRGAPFAAVEVAHLDYVTEEYFLAARRRLTN